MEKINVVDNIHSANGWLMENQALIISYIVNIAAAMIILVIGFAAARFISRLLNKILCARSVDVIVVDFLSVIVRYSLIAFTLIAALGRVGVQTASVIAVLGAAGLAVGLALQGSLSNLAAGVLLVTLRPFKTGEYVDLGGIAGTVLSVQIFSTTLKASDGKIIVVPNGKIITGNIINYSREPVRRNEFIIGVAYDADSQRVMQLLRQVVEADERVLVDLGVQVGMQELAASSVNYIVRCWSKSTDLQQVYWDLLARFKQQLDENGISIPYPQLDVRLQQAVNLPHQ